MELKDILPLIVSTAAFLVAVASLVHSIYSNTANRRSDDLQRVRGIVTSNIAKFNGILTGLQHKPEPTADDLMEPARLYSEMRDAYRSFRHSFSARDRSKLDALLNDIEDSYDSDDLASSLKSALTKMPAFLNALEAKLHGDAGGSLSR